MLPPSYIFLLNPDRYKQLDIAIEALDTTVLGLDYQQTAAVLNAPTLVPNPVPQGTIKTGSVITAIQQLMAAPGGISAGDMSAIQATNTEFDALKKLGEALGQQSVGLNEYLALLQAKTISDSAAAVLAEELSKTAPDPNWQATIETLSAFQPPATAEDVQAYYADRDTYEAEAIAADQLASQAEE